MTERRLPAASRSLRRDAALAPRLLLAAAVVGLSAFAVGEASASLAASGLRQAPTDRESLASTFRAIRASATEGAGFLDRDRPVMRRFLEATAASLDGRADDVEVVAMDLQVAIWLDEDRDRIRAGFDRMASLRPDDPAVVLARIDWRESVGELDEAEALATLERLAAETPDDPVLLALCPRLMDEARYGEVVELISPRIGETDSVELQVVHGEALFNANRFDEAAAAADAIDWQRPGGARLRQRVEQLRTQAARHAEWWTEEQALRAAEAEADDLPRVALQTNKGRIVIELFENEAPNTVANFVKLCREGFYDGTRFHRFEKNFMVQGGDPLSREGAEGVPGTGGPGYRIPDEHGDENDRRHFGDSVSMANTGIPDSGGSQFFLNHRPTDWLNGRHTVFGRIIEGLDVAHALRKDDEILQAEVLRARDRAYEPEVIRDEPEDAPDAADGGEGEGEGDRDGG